MRNLLFHFLTELLENIQSSQEYNNTIGSNERQREHNSLMTGSRKLFRLYAFLCSNE